MLRAAVAVSLALLTACGTPSRDEQLASYRDRCVREFGFVPGSAHMASCVQALDMEAGRRADRALDALQDSLRQVSIPTPAPQVATPPPYNPFPLTPSPGLRGQRW
jgi:hypothetical protein